MYLRPSGIFSILAMTIIALMRERYRPPMETESHGSDRAFADRLQPTGFDARNIDLWQIKDDPARLARENRPAEGQSLDDLEGSIREGEAFFAQMRDKYGIRVVAMEIRREKNVAGQETVFTLVDKIDGQNLSEMKELPAEAKDELEQLYVSLGRYYDDARKQQRKFWGDARSDQFVYGSKDGETDEHFYLTDVDPEFYREGEDEWHTIEAVMGSVSHDLVENEAKFGGGMRLEKAREKMLCIIDEMLKENFDQPMLVEARGWLER